MKNVKVVFGEKVILHELFNKNDKNALEWMGIIIFLQSDKT